MERLFVSKGFSIRIKLVLEIFHEDKIALRMVPFEASSDW